MIVYLARDIPAFVMYCVHGESRSSLLIESTDSMIIYIYIHTSQYHIASCSPGQVALSGWLSGVRGVGVSVVTEVRDREICVATAGGHDSWGRE